jgi:hypothetical protein
MLIKHFGKIVNGKKVYYNDSLHKEAVKSLEGKEFEEVLKEKSKRVTTDQHAYYRKGVIGTALEFEMFGGWDKESLHDFFVGMFLTEKTYRFLDNGNAGSVTTFRTRSTASLNRKEMAQFIDNCIKWLATQGIVVLDSDQFLLTNYK